jgi:hypothetical protein
VSLSLSTPLQSPNSCRTCSGGRRGIANHVSLFPYGYHLQWAGAIVDDRNLDPCAGHQRTLLVYVHQLLSGVIARHGLSNTCLIAPVLVMFRVGQIHATITSNVNRHVTVYTLLVVLIESGAAAFFTTAILLPTFVAKQNAHYIVCDAVSTFSCPPRFSVSSSHF